MCVWGGGATQSKSRHIREVLGGEVAEEQLRGEVVMWRELLGGEVSVWGQLLGGKVVMYVGRGA